MRWTPEFGPVGKLQKAMAIAEVKTPQQIAAEYNVHPTQILSSAYNSAPGFWLPRSVFYLLRFNDCKVREIVAVIPSVSGKQTTRMTNRMRSDQEIRQHTFCRPVSLEVGAIHFAREH